MDKETFLKNSKPVITILGEFKNKHGEEFLIYRIHGVIKTYITGDELDWEVGWEFEPGRSYASNHFSLTSEEADEAETVTKNYDRKKE